MTKRLFAAVCTLLGSASSASLVLAGVFVAAPSRAHEQDAPAAEEAEAGDLVVTGTRVIRDGYEAPTPTTVLGIEEIERRSDVNIFTQLNTLPVFQNSYVQAVTVTNVGTGVMGLNALNLRGLGYNRTLVLLDGQRLAPSTVNDLVNINEVPNAIIKRVDVVTGGASAGWGSDAVAGVVNFVIDKDFTGIKGEVQGGVSTYGDGASYKVTLSAGTPFASGRGHIVVSGETSKSAEIRGVPRKWVDRGTKIINNPAYTATNGQPQYLVRDQVGYSTFAPGAIVSAGPLRGLYFGPNGAPAQLNFGAIDASPNIVGGDWRYTDLGDGPQSLQPENIHHSLYAHAGYDLTDDINVHASFNYVHASGFNTGYPIIYTGLAIQRDNAFLPTDVVARMQALNLTSLTVGTSAADLGSSLVRAEHDDYRYSAGANGRFTALGGAWNWEVFGNWSENKYFNNANLTVTANFRAAIDAVRNQNGAIVCRSTLTNPTNGCVPLNILGTGVASEAARNYVLGNSRIRGAIKQQEYAATLRGEPFSTWAGPASIALGAQHRRLSESGVSDALSLQNAYIYGNYKPIVGSYTVKEAFLEVVVPLAKDTPWARSLDFNAAVRATDYSSSGYVTTWKLGATYEPIDDIRFRVTRSRDIRAGSLSELFAAGTAGTSLNNDPLRNNEAYPVLNLTLGNPSVKPEKGDYLGVGAVFRPSFVPGLSASLDYWRIEVTDAIGAFSPQTSIDQCAAGVQSFCDLVTRDASGLITQVRSIPINFAKQLAKGVDLEAGYELPLRNIAASLGDGRLSFRFVGTRNLKNVSDNRITVPNDNLGEASFGSTSKWQYVAQVVYQGGPLIASLTGRGISGGVLSRSWVECATGCPTSTVDNRTIDQNRYSGIFYLDATASVDITETLRLFFNVDNLFNKNKGIIPQGPGVSCCGALAANAKFDTIGRYFRGGVKVRF
jgi:iron complex outermembrane recepter protein